MEQLHSLARTRSVVTSKRTRPQWQAPAYVCDRRLPESGSVIGTRVSSRPCLAYVPSVCSSTYPGYVSQPTFPDGMPTNEERSARPHRFAPSPSERAAERRVSGAPERLAGRVLPPHPLQQLVDFAGDRRERLARLLGARDHHRPFAERAEEEVHERLRRPRADESSGHRVAQAHLQQAERIAGVDLPPGLPAEHDGAVAQDDLLDLAVGAGLEEPVAACDRALPGGVA